MGTKPLKVLLIDDDKSIHQLVRKFINPLVTLECVSELPSAREFFQYDLILLDLWLGPNENSLDFLSSVEDSLPEVLDRIILLTAATSVDAEIKTHKLGLRDYIRKPFDPRVFSAVIDKHLLTLKKSTSELRFGLFRLDLANYQAFTKDEGKLDLTNTEFKILKLMVEGKGRIVTREKLMSDVWDLNDDIQTRTVDMHISSLRKKLGKAGDTLKTKRGIGYYLAEN